MAMSAAYSFQKGEHTTNVKTLQMKANVGSKDCEMKVKPGVKVQGVRPELVFALVIAEEVWRQLELPELTVTSVLDGVHSATSLHYAGCAVDLRTRDFPTEVVPVVVAALKDRLGVDFDVVAESTHIHLEYQPRRG